MPARWRPAFAESYAVLLVTVAAARLTLAVLGGRAMIASQELALAWPTFLVLALLGFGALFLAERAGFAERWRSGGPAWRDYALAAAAGLVYGLLSASGDVASAVQADRDRASVFGTSDIHEPFPASIPFYWYGAGFLEIFLRLIGLTFLTWLAAQLLRRRRPELSFWIANVIVSLYEPWPHLVHELGTAPAAAWPSLVAGVLLGQLFLANLFTGALYRRRGVFCAVVFRYAHYLVWHIAYGSFRSRWLERLLG